MTHVRPLEPRRLMAADPGGTLVDTFGDHGAVTLSGRGEFAPTADGGAVYEAPDGSVSRLLASGKVDPSFGTDGVVAAAVLDASLYSIAHSLQVLPDGRVLGVSVNGAGVRAEMFMLRPDGTPDATFGQGGLLQFDGTDDYSQPMLGTAIGLPGGGVVYSTEVGLDGTQTLHKLDEDNRPDPAYGTATLPTLFDLRLTDATADGKVYGYDRDAIARFTADGSLDVAFGSGGSVPIPSGRTLVPLGVTTAGGLLVVAHESDTDFTGSNAATVVPAATHPDHVVRLTAAGAVDATYGGAGPAGVPLAQVLDAYGEHFGLPATALPDGGFMVVRIAVPTDGTAAQYAATRYAADGTPDAAFGPDGTGTATGTIDASPPGQANGNVIGATADGDVFATDSYYRSAPDDPTAGVVWSQALVKIDGGTFAPPTASPTPPPVVSPTPVLPVTASPASTLSSAMTLSRQPAVLVAGQRAAGTSVVRLTNTGTATVAGAVTIELRLTSTADGTSSPLTTAVRQLKLRPGRSALIRVPLGTVAADLNGRYTLAGRVTTADLAVSTSTSTVILDVRPPVAEVTPTFLPTTESPAHGDRRSVVLTLTNTGTVAAVGPVTITTAATAGTTLRPAAVAASSVLHRQVRLAPGASKRVRITLGTDTAVASVTFDGQTTTVVGP